eukprot:10358814-Alexandrium_andersonii.AAC.1
MDIADLGSWARVPWQPASPASHAPEIPMRCGALPAPPHDVALEVLLQHLGALAEALDVLALRAHIGPWLELLLLPQRTLAAYDTAPCHSCKSCSES